MLKAHYDQKQNLVPVEFEGKVDAKQAEQFYPKIRKVVPKHGKGFKLLTDFTRLEMSVRQCWRRIVCATRYGHGRTFR